jgi:hypothetical protein
VILQHQLIEVAPAGPMEPEPMKRPKPEPRLRHTVPATRLASGPVRQESLGVRARRAFLGDGRYRPEPFPRLER